MSITKELAAVRDLLEQKGTKLTKQREAIILFLLEHPEQHFTVEEIFTHIKATHPDIGIATIYRSVELYFDLRLVEKLTYDTGICRYSFIKSEDRHLHHNLLCMKCKKVKIIKKIG
ncbi:Fur family transcriptional regulator [Paenibacillus albus]|uniref:Transcriptional repressor n=1 Tax=Paenibacillus albus TaxID=2495582 RepID=A0A3S9A5W9_9BACL|nr:transcriptional repressor [Paenibacillus albus]AZN41115.1 transcriptional repressor [Paenibacillus albus]